MKIPQIKSQSEKIEHEPLPNNPLAFDVAEHGARYRRCNCVPDGIQHILFVLDTSGSIGESDFNRVTAKLSELVILFCKPIKVAVMTFDHEYFVEFCFNCFDNTCDGRSMTSTAISTIIIALDPDTPTQEVQHNAYVITCSLLHVIFHLMQIVSMSYSLLMVSPMILTVMFAPIFSVFTTDRESKRLQWELDSPTV